MDPVDVSIDPDENPTSQALLTGSICIAADGEVLTRRMDEDGEPVSYNRNPDGYVGTRVLSDLLELTNAVLSLKRGEVDLYGQRRAQFAGERFDTVFERLSDRAVRICYQVRPVKSGRFEYPISPPGAVLGAAVDLDELCDQVVECDEKLLAFAEDADLDVEEPPLAAIDEKIDELRGLQTAYEGFPNEDRN